jgi:hypothetical protein
MLTLDSKTDQFIGDNAETANQLLKRKYRGTFTVPEIVS